MLLTRQYFRTKFSYEKYCLILYHYLFAENMSKTKQKEKDLGKAAENGESAAVRRLLSERVDPNNFEYVSSSYKFI